MACSGGARSNAMCGSPGTRRVCWSFGRLVASLPSKQGRHLSLWLLPLCRRQKISSSGPMRQQSQDAGETSRLGAARPVAGSVAGIVIAHTRLPLRIVARGRSSEYQRKATSFSRVSLLTVHFSLVAIPIIPLATAILAFVAPLTRTPALNLYTSVTLGAVGVGLLLLPSRYGQFAVPSGHQQRPPPAPLDLPHAPPLTHPRRRLPSGAPPAEVRLPFRCS